MNITVIAETDTRWDIRLADGDFSTVRTILLVDGYYLLVNPFSLKMDDTRYPSYDAAVLMAKTSIEHSRKVKE